MSQTTDYLRDVFEYGIDQRERRVFLQTFLGQVSEEEPFNAVEYVTRGLLLLDRAAGPIELWVNSEGGVVEDALAIYDVIQGLSNEVRTVGHGQIMSAAVLLLACGTGKRWVTENSVFMNHEGTTDLPDSPRALQKIEIAHSDWLDEQWARLMGRHTRPKRAWKWWLNVTKTNPALYLDAQRMITHGVADAIWPGVVR